MPEIKITANEYVNNAWVVDHRQALARESNKRLFGETGRYELSLDQLRTLIERLDRLSNRISHRIDNAESLRQVRPPGSDLCSRKVAEVMNKSGEAYIISLEKQRDAVTQLHDQLFATLCGYQETEEVNRVELGNADGSRETGDR